MDIWDLAVGWVVKEREAEKNIVSRFLPPQATTVYPVGTLSPFYTAKSTVKGRDTPSSPEKDSISW